MSPARKPAALLLAATALAAATPAAAAVEILDFTATWCGPCQRMKPLVHVLAARGFPIREVEVTEHPEVARRYGVTAYPTFMLVDDGREVTRVTGVQSAADLERLLASAPSPVAPAEPVRGDFVRPVVVAETSGRGTVRTVSESLGASAPLAMPPAAATRTGGNRSSQAVGPVVRAQNAGVFDPAEPATTADPVAATVRVRVNNVRDKDGKRGINFGSATMIGFKAGRVVAVSCAHTFRGMDDGSSVEVDLFGGPTADAVETVPARVVRVDPEADVSVIAFVPPPGRPVARLASSAEAVEAGDHVFSVGCDDGSEPDKRQHRVTRVNAYEGPDTVECTGTPKTGRSGGGLFDKRGRLVGVCFAAHHELGRGIYAGLGEIHTILREAGLPEFCPGGAATPPVEVAAPEADEFTAVLAAVDELSKADVTPEAAFDALPMTDAASGNAAGSDYDGPMEVVVIIRRPGAAEGEGDVVVINEASPMFLKYLRGETDGAGAATAADASRGASAEDRDGFEWTEPTSGRLERFTRGR
ncbi:MAG: trypsin-like peptidase domain-containing protein [Planctomycetota bacterium]